MQHLSTRCLLMDATACTHKKINMFIYKSAAYSSLSHVFLHFPLPTIIHTLSTMYRIFKIPENFKLIAFLLAMHKISEYYRLFPGISKQQQINKKNSISVFQSDGHGDHYVWELLLLSEVIFLSANIYIFKHH